MFQSSLEFEILRYPSFLGSKNYSSFLRVFNGSPVSPQSEAYFQEFPVASLPSAIRKVRIHECCSTGKPLEIYRYIKIHKGSKTWGWAYDGLFAIFNDIIIKVSLIHSIEDEKKKLGKHFQKLWDGIIDWKKKKKIIKNRN